MILLRQVFEVFHNFVKDHFRLPISEFSVEPHNRLIVGFATVASPTRWKHIQWGSPRTIKRIQRYPMVSRNGIIKTLLTSAVSATVMPVVKTGGPIIIGKRGNATTQTCTVSMFSHFFECTFFQGIGFLPGDRMSLSILLMLTFQNSIPIGSIMFSMYSLRMLFMGLPPLSIQLAFMVIVFLCPFRLNFTSMFGMLFSPFRTHKGSTFFTGIPMSIFARFGGMEFRQRQNQSTFRASFCRGIHSVSLSLYHKLVLADGVICRLFGCTALANTLNYTTSEVVFPC